MRRQRPLGVVPNPVLALLAGALLLQVIWHAVLPPPQARAADLPAAAPAAQLRIASLGDPVAAAKVLMLWLQAFDNQPGISIPFRSLDYGHVETWLARLLDLDPRGQYPLLAASRLYGAVPDQDRQRQMLDFVYRAYAADPARRWQWLAEAAMTAKHRLHDLPLALKFARALADTSDNPDIPHWARQLEIFVLEDMGELESARVLIGGLLESGRITDPNELRFMTQRLEALELRQKAPIRGAFGG